MPKHRDYHSPDLQFMVRDYKDKVREQMDVVEKLKQILIQIYEQKRIEEEQRRLLQQVEEEELRIRLEKEAICKLIAESVSNPQYPIVSGMSKILNFFRLHVFRFLLPSRS